MPGEEGWLAELAKTGAPLSAALGWLWFVYRWSDALTPKSPIARARRIYFDLEDQFYEQIVRRVFAVLDANQDKLRAYGENRVAVQYALGNELEGVLQTLNFGRGQRARATRHGRFRLVGLVIMWSLTFGILALVLGAVGFDDRLPVMPLFLKRPRLLIAAVVLFVLAVGCMFGIRHQGPLIEDALNSLEAIRDALRR